MFPVLTISKNVGKPYPYMHIDGIVLCVLPGQSCIGTVLVNSVQYKPGWEEGISAAVAIE